MPAEKVFFPYVPEWKGNRARWRVARERDPAARPDVSIEIHCLSASEAKAIAKAAVSASRPRKGESAEEIQERAELAVEAASAKVFSENLRNPVGFKTLSGDLATVEQIWSDAAPQLVQELLGAIEDESRLEDGLRDRSASPSSGTPPATTA